MRCVIFVQSQAGGATGPSVLSVDDAVSALTHAVDWARIGHFSLPGARLHSSRLCYSGGIMISSKEVVPSVNPLLKPWVLPL